MGRPSSAARSGGTVETDQDGVKRIRRRTGRRRRLARKKNGTTCFRRGDEANASRKRAGDSGRILNRPHGDETVSFYEKTIRGT